MCGVSEVSILNKEIFEAVKERLLHDSSSCVRSVAAVQVHWDLSIDIKSLLKRMWREFPNASKPSSRVCRRNKIGSIWAEHKKEISSSYCQPMIVKEWESILG
jgi:hypothetical protein